MPLWTCLSLCSAQTRAALPCADNDRDGAEASSASGCACPWAALRRGELPSAATVNHRRALLPRALARTCGRGRAQAGTRLGHTPHPGIGAGQWAVLVLHQGGIYHQHGKLAPH